ncbi:MAG: efflux RND transporter periplasmic adaptor subunit [Myxococcales bacterium]|nr:MAG: efflux RND transporter periplasmic adaptor subunit [Myxococcales bacterium]
MRSLIVTLLVVPAAMPLSACSKTEHQHSSGSHAPTSSAKPAAAPVGDGMCEEHRVLEAVCTQCNPKLIPVFKDKQDWCEKHGFPESFCPSCHPERGGRPAAEVSADAAPADGTRIRFKSKQTATIAGIETARAAVRPNQAALVAPARVAYDATRLALVNARSPGVVRELKVDTGSKVKKGDALMTIDSAGVGADRARLVAARARVRVADESFRRESQLETEGVSTRASVLRAQQELDSAKSEEAALAASLSVLGASSQGVGGYTLTAPLSGIVTDRQINVGRFVGTQEVLLQIVDTTEVWAELDVAEPDLPAVRVGQSVALTFEGLPGHELGGVISYVAPAIDPHTRSAKARVPLQNADGMLRANLYGQARIAAGEGRSGVSVPRAAVHRVSDVPLVFVRLADDEFETRRVQLGASTDAYFEVLEGVQVGESVVTTGSFLLKTETLKDGIGAGCEAH